jgi:hypothetical protein
MPFTLIPPGKRKGNTWFIVRGKVGGKLREFSTKTRDPEAARRFALNLELALLDSGVPGAEAEVSFARAAELYKSFRNPAKLDCQRIDKIVAVLGDRTVRSIQHAELVAAANDLYPGRKPETKNRGVIKPAAAILHYAARNKWCEWLRIERFEEATPATRAATADTARLLLAALAKEIRDATTPRKKNLARKKRLLILWIFKHWNRISEPLTLRWKEHIDLRERVYLLHVSKSDQWKRKPIDEEAFEALANEPAKEREGWLFPWRTRSGVYKWLRPLCKSLKIRFTPHMARHFGGKELNRQGAGLKTIMGALDHLDPQSSVRYQDADIDIVREAMGRVGKVGRATRRTTGAPVQNRPRRGA